MPRRKAWRGPLLVGALALAALLLAVGAYTNLARQQRSLALAIEARRQQDFADLITHLDNLRASLVKAAAAASSQQQVLHLSDAWHHGRSAQAHLTALPLPADVTWDAAQFLTTAADYARVTARSAARGNETPPERWVELYRLAEQSDALHDAFTTVDLQARQNGGVRWEAAAAQQATWRAALAPMLPRGAGQPARQHPSGPAGPPADLAAGFAGAVTIIQEYPQLIYDGPFSAHLESRQAQGLAPGTITPDEAVERARRFAPTGAAAGALEAPVEVAGDIPAYSVRLGDPNGAAPVTVVDVTQQGGHLLRLLHQRELGPARLDLGAAADRARSFLAERGYPGLVPVQVLDDGDQAVVALAPEQNGVLLLTDLVKAKVALDSGDVVGVEAWNYLMSRRERRLPRPLLTAAQAEQSLRPELAVVDQRLTWIPLPGGRETLAWEFTADLDADRRFLIFVDALSGEELEILWLAGGEGGRVQ